LNSVRRTEREAACVRMAGRGKTGESLKLAEAEGRDKFPNRFFP
jgi:hypothetical protein